MFFKYYLIKKKTTRLKAVNNNYVGMYIMKTIIIDKDRFKIDLSSGMDFISADNFILSACL